MAIISRDPLEAYHTSFFNWLGTLRLDYGTEFAKNIVTGPLDLSNKEIFRVWGTPERAVQDPRNELKAQGFFPASYWTAVDQVKDKDSQLKLYPYPMVRLYSTAVPPTMQLHQVPALVRMLASNGLKWKYFQPPLPYEVIYTADFFSRTEVSMRYIERWLLRQFSKVGANINEQFLTVQHIAPWGPMIAPMQLVSVVDNSDLSVSGPQERTIRKTVDIRMRAWIVDDGSGTGTTGHPKEVGAITGVRVCLGFLDEYDKDLDLYGNLVESDLLPQTLLNLTPFPFKYSFPGANVETLHGLVPDDATTQYLLPAAGDNTVRTLAIPFRDDELVISEIAVKWRCADDVARDLPVEMGVWDETLTTPAFVPLQTTMLSNGLTEQVFRCYMIVGTDAQYKGVCVRCKPCSGAAQTRVAIKRWTLSRIRLGTNYVDAGDRTLGPELPPTYDVTTASGLVPGDGYLVRGSVTGQVSNVTISVYSDAAATKLLSTTTITSTAPTEFGMYVQVADWSRLLIRVTTAAGDAVVSGLGCYRLVPPQFQQ